MEQHENLMLLKKQRYQKLYKAIVEKGINYFEPGFELYYLHMAHSILAEFILEEKYEECAVIKETIELFMFQKPGALEILLRNMRTTFSEIDAKMQKGRGLN